MKTTAKRVQKLISFPIELYQALNIRAQKLGMLFPEYVRHISANIVEADGGDVEILDEQTSRSVEKSLKEYRQGKYMEFYPNNKKEMHKILYGE